MTLVPSVRAAGAQRDEALRCLYALRERRVRAQGLRALKGPAGTTYVRWSPPWMATSTEVCHVVSPYFHAMKSM